MTEVHTMIGVMRTGEDEKKKVGLSIPESIVGAFDNLCESKVNGKEKWLVLVAALSAFMELEESKQNDWIAKVMNANAPGRSFVPLVPKQYRNLKIVATKGAEIRRLS